MGRHPGGRPEKPAEGGGRKRSPSRRMTNPGGDETQGRIGSPPWPTPRRRTTDFRGEQDRAARRGREGSKPRDRSSQGHAGRDRCEIADRSPEGKTSEGRNPMSATGMKQGWGARGGSNRQEGAKPWRRRCRARQTRQSILRAACAEGEQTPWEWSGAAGCRATGSGHTLKGGRSPGEAEADFLANVGGSGGTKTRKGPSVRKKAEAGSPNQ